MSVTVQQINKQLRNDFDDLISGYAHSWREPLSAIDPLFRVYCHCSALAKLSELVPSTVASHRREYLVEFSADAVGVAHCSMAGDLRGARFYLRSGIENLLRHVYYSDHPIEFGWTNDASGKFFLEPSELREYATKQPVLQKCSTMLGQLSSSYAALSRHVHTGTTVGMTLRKTLSDLRLTDAELKSFAKDLDSVTKNAVAILFIFHNETVNDLEARGKRWLIHQLDSTRKKLLSGL